MLTLLGKAGELHSVGQTLVEHSALSVVDIAGFVNSDVGAIWLESSLGVWNYCRLSRSRKKCGNEAEFGGVAHHIK
jgi:hypothetical protein